LDYTWFELYEENGGKTHTVEQDGKRVSPDQPKEISGEKPSEVEMVQDKSKELDADKVEA
jgi:hypothetical protein